MNSKTIVLFFCAIYALVFLCGLAELFRARKANCKNEVRLPVLYFWIGTVVSAVFLVIAWLSAVQENSIALTLGFGVFVLLGISLMLAWRNCHITFDHTGFTQKNLLGFRRNFTYGELTAWRHNNTNPMESFLYVGKKKISFNILHQNGPAFIKAVRHGYRNVHGGNALPDMGNILRAGTGFRAHVHNPGEFLFIFIMLVVFLQAQVFGAPFIRQGQSPQKMATAMS